MIFSHPDFSVQPIGAKMQADSLFACFNDMRVLLQKQNHQLPRAEQVIPLLGESFVPFELAHTGNRVIFTFQPHCHEKIPETEELEYFSLNIFRSLPFETAALITTSWHLWSWYQNHRFCGR